MIPFTPKWFKAREKQRLDEKCKNIEYKIRRMIELAKLEKECGKNNVACALVRRLSSLDEERDQIKQQIKNIKQGHAPYLS